MGSSENFSAKVAAAVEYANRGATGNPASPSIDRRQPTSLPDGAGAGTASEKAENGDGAQTESGVRAVSVQNRKALSVRNKALTLYEKIGNEFARIYDEESASKSYRYFLLELRKHQRTLVDGGIYTAKELDERVKELQSHLKEGGDEGKMTMADAFSQWLNAEPTNEKSKEELLPQGEDA
jgi:hypothetical protein